jgi:tetratricopeptide (TPR) repeat protein
MLNFNKITRLTEYLLGASALVGIFLFLQLYMNSELSDPDIWLHLKTGEYIMQNKTIPKLDMYSASTAGKTWIDHSPLTQVIFYWAFNSGGPDKLIYLSCVVILLAFLLLFFCIYKNKSTLSLCVIIFALSVFASRIRFNIRPENFSVLFFCIYLFILTRYKNKKFVFLLPLIQLAWVNCHGFFILGPVIIATFIIAEGLKRSKKLPWEWSDIYPINKNSYRNLIIIFLLSVLTSLANPNGIEGALYPLTIVLKTFGHPNAIHGLILELLPPWKLHLGQALPYYLLVFVSFVSFLFNFRKINFTYLLLWLALLAISFNINRNIIFFNCLACLVSADNFLRSNRQLPEKLTAHNLLLVIKYAALTAIILFSADYGWRMLNDRYYLFEENRLKSSLLGISNYYPDKATDFILKNKLPDNLFNTFNHGSYLIYRLYPTNHVFIDGRTELYDNETLKDYFRMLYTDASTIDNLLKQYKINTILLSGDLILTEDLTRHLDKSKDWALVYLNEDALIFVRRLKSNENLTRQLYVDLNKQEIKKADLKKIGFCKVIPNPHIRWARLFLILGAEQKAELQVKEALSILPNSGEANAILGKIYLRKDTPEQAYQYLRLASIYAPDNILTLDALSDYYLRINDKKNAEKVFKKITQVHPKYAQGYYLLGLFYLNSGNLDRAIKYLGRATKLAPYSTKYSNKLKEVIAQINDL